MDFDLTVTGVGTDRMDELLEWLRQDSAASQWTYSPPADDPDSGRFRIRGEVYAAARLAQSLIAWLNMVGRTASTVTVAVDTPSGRESVVLTSLQADIARIRDAILPLATREPLDEPEPPRRRADPESSTQPWHHTSPGPVLDPDDDWARDAEES